MQYAAAARAFDKGDFETCLEQFFLAIHSRYDIEKPAARRLIRRKLGVVNLLREQKRKLQAQMEAQKKSLQKYAREYLLMGNECITQAHDVRAPLPIMTKRLSSIPNTSTPGYEKESRCSTKKSSSMPRIA